ncbi:MAG: hypothetical protein JXA69_06735, partial [Phycisphaerae bacterium]|nr:hypothetical protein [Phycisphaerae bacterium]
TIEALDGSRVELRNSDIQYGTFTTAGTGAIRVAELTTLRDIQQSGLLEVESSQRLRLSGTITNSGTIAMQSDGSDTYLMVVDGDVRLVGGGTLSLTDTEHNRIGGGPLTVRLINEDNTIVGGGSIGMGQIGLINRGTIHANGSQVLTLRPSAAGGVNSGTIQASSGTLRLSGEWDNYEATTDGVIRADDATVELDAVNMEGGVLTTTGTGIVSVFGGATSSLRSVENAGALRLSDGAMRLDSAITNSGTLRVGEPGHAAMLRIVGLPMVLDGSGTVQLVEGNIIADAALARLVNLDNTIEGRGTIGSPNLSLINRGVIDANVLGEWLELSPGSDGGTNAGTLQATDGGLLRIGGPWQNYNGETAGTILADGGMVTLAGSAMLEGGLVTTAGSGQIRVEAEVTFKDVTSAGDIDLPNAAHLRLEESFTNEGALTLHQSDTYLQVQGGDVVLAGGGTVTLENQASIRGATATDRLINEDNTIAGAGRVGDASMAIRNGGTIDANVAEQELRVQPNASGAENAGTMQASGGGGLILSGTIDNGGGTIQALDGSTVELEGPTITGGTFTTAGTGTIRSRSTSMLKDIANAGRLTVPDGTTMTVVGTLTNSGTVLLESQGGSAGLSVGSAPVLLTGGGVLRLSGNASWVGGGANIPLANGEHAIEGFGNVGTGNLKITNAGLIDANVADKELWVQPGPLGVRNSGVLQARNGATLHLEHTIDNTDGTIQALDGSIVKLATASVYRGTVTTAGTGLVSVHGTSTFTQVANTGYVEVENYATLYLNDSTVANSGTIFLHSTGNNTDLRLNGEARLTGGGLIELSDQENNRIVGETDDRLINEDNTIRGAGRIGDDQFKVVNRGVIEANGTRTLAMRVYRDTPSFNSGVLQATGGATLELGGDWINFEGMVDGVIRAEAGTVVLDGTYLGGQVEVTNGGELKLQNAMVTWALLTNAAGGTVRVTSATTNVLDGTLQNAAGATVVVGGGRLTFKPSGTYNNEGRIEVVSGWDLVIDGGDVTVSGGGGLALINGNVVGLNPWDRLVNADNTVSGNGWISVAMTNGGTVDAVGGTLYLSSESKVNDGVCKASSGGILRVDTDVSGSGDWIADGGEIRLGESGPAVVTTTGDAHVKDNSLLKLQNASELRVANLILAPLAFLRIEGGMVVVSGNVSFTMAEELRWQWAPGTRLVMVGDATQGCGVVPWTTLEVGGQDLGPGLFGPANFGLPHLELGENAAVALIDAKDNGNRTSGSEVLYTGALTLGVGATLNLNGLHLYVNGVQVAPGLYGDGEVVDEALPPMADFDCDGDVDLADFGAFAACFNGPNRPPTPSCAADADSDGDGDVDLADFGVFSPCFNGPNRPPACP